MKDCLFCKIIEGNIPSEKIYEDDNILVFKDIHPVATIHLLVIPKKHIENILDIKEKDKDLLFNIFKSIQKVSEILNINKSGFRVISNCGKNAGQEVMHLHFHILAGEKLGPKIR